MTRGARDLGQLLASTNSIPESLQIALTGGAILSFMALWGLDVASVFVLIPATLGGSLALYFIAFRIPALHSLLRVHEHGLESVVHGKSASFAYDELGTISARFTDHFVNNQYIGTKAKLEFFRDDRLTPHIHECEFRHGNHGERVVALAIAGCSQAIERRLLAELEREGAIRWRDNVSLTAEGLLLADPGGAERLIPYGQIGGWKVVDGQLRIWKTGDALPFFVMGNDTPNFTPLLGLFQSLCQAIHNVEPEPAAVG
jgi:hypothetical protein